MSKVVKSQDAVNYPLFEPGALSAKAASSGTSRHPDFVDSEALLASLKAEAETKVREAYEEGLRRGEEAGRAQFLERVGEAASALTTASHALQHARQEFLESLERDAMNLVVAISERVVRREVRGDRDLILRTVRAALEEMLGTERVVLHLNPEDLEALRAEKVTLLAEFDAVAELELRQDPAIESGGCIAESPTMQVDGRMHTQLQRIFDAMLE